eukprot:2916237-Amphidinium_carterae.1
MCIRDRKKVLVRLSLVLAVYAIAVEPTVGSSDRAYSCFVWVNMLSKPYMSLSICSQPFSQKCRAVYSLRFNCGHNTGSNAVHSLDQHC